MTSTQSLSGGIDARRLSGVTHQAQVIRSTWVIALLTAVSRILGLVREITLGYYFATSGTLSAFRIAFMLPNLARRLFGEGALSAAMIPVLSETLRVEGEDESRRFVGRLLTAVTALLLAAATAAILILMAANRLYPDPALGLASLLMPYMAMICLAAVIGGILNVRGRFAAPAVMPVLLNVGVILGAVGGARWLGRSDEDLIRIVCYGVLAAGIGQVLLSLLALRAADFLPRLEWNVRDARMRRVAGLMGPMVLGLSAVQINSLTDYLIAYGLITDNGDRVGPAVLGYAQFLYQLPLGVFGIAIATAIFPELARRGAASDHKGLGEVMADGLRLGAFIALPASVGLIFIAHPLVAALYQRGQFNAENVERVSGTLIFYAIGMIGYFSQHVIVRSYYALHDSRTPARIALCMVVINVVLNFSLVFVMQERGLALSTAVCAIVQAIWLTLLLSRRLPGLDWKKLTSGLGRIAIATAVMASALTICFIPGIRQALAQSDAIRTIVLLFVGIASYGAAGVALRVPELKRILKPGIDERHLN